MTKLHSEVVWNAALIWFLKCVWMLISDVKVSFDSQHNNNVKSRSTEVHLVAETRAATSRAAWRTTQRTSACGLTLKSILCCHFGGVFCKTKLLSCWKATSTVYLVTGSCIVTTATHANRLVMSGHTNSICFEEQIWFACSPHKALDNVSSPFCMKAIPAASKKVLIVQCAPPGHAPRVPGPGEGARSCTPPLFPHPSVKEKEESGLSGHLCARPACKPSTTERLAALHALPRQHELTQQHRQPVAQTHTQVWTGNTHYIDCADIQYTHVQTPLSVNTRKCIWAK